MVLHKEDVKNLATLFCKMLKKGYFLAYKDLKTKAGLFGGNAAYS